MPFDPTAPGSYEQINLESGFRRNVRFREESPAKQQFRPSWQCDVDGVWLDYPVDVSQLLESQQSTGGKAIFSLHPHQYEVDFSAMIQVNTVTKCQRQVRREIVLMDEIDFEFEFPSTWTSADKGNGCQTIKVSKNTHEWNMVEKQLHCTLPGASLQQLQRVQNIQLWKYFEFQSKRLKSKSESGTANIQSVWHGTKATDPKVICTDKHDGFMTQRSQRGNWGLGTYFAANASYSSNGYAFQEGNTKTLILVRLAVGEDISLPQNPLLRHCPDKPNGEGRYDTVTGVTNGSKVFIVYENGRGYPEYLVTYTGG